MYPLSLWFRLICPAVITVTVGCAPQLFWAKSGAQRGEFEEDLSQCRETIMSGSGHEGHGEDFPLTLRISDDAVEQCLMAKGWILTEKP